MNHRINKYIGDDGGECDTDSTLEWAHNADNLQYLDRVMVGRLVFRLRAAEAKLREREAWASEEDKSLPEDLKIDAAFPTRSHRHDLYQEAMRMVGAKKSKGALVALVNWLLHEKEKT